MAAKFNWRRQGYSFAVVISGLACATGALAQDFGVPANPLLVAHSNFFTPPIVYDLKQDEHTKDIFPPGVTYRAYSAVGYDIANTIMLAGPNGRVVIVDTLGDEGSVATVLPLWQAKLGLSPGDRLPIDAVIYTHNHLDHIGGVLKYLSEADKPTCDPEDPTQAGQDGPFTARQECVEVIGQANIIDGVSSTATVSGDIIGPRSVYMYGSALPGGPVNVGIGPKVNGGVSGFRLPSHTFSNNFQFKVAGLTLEISWEPSETNDELAVFLPDSENGGPQSTTQGLLLSAEVIQGPSFPNLYSLRGTEYRSPATWFKSVDALRDLNSWCMIPSHGPPLCGADNVALLLRTFRDAIQFTHDQTVRFMNVGYTPDEIVGLFSLPQYLFDDLAQLQPAMPQPNMDAKDYLRAFYGSVPQSIREIYFGYVGWFQADPVLLNPTPPVELAQNYVDLMGGPLKVLAAARAAYDQGNYQFSAELTTLLIRIDNTNLAARALKAKAFRQLAQRVTNPNWRNWYLSSAIELNLNVRFPAVTGGLISPDIVAGLPPGRWVESFTFHFNPETNGENESSMGFLFPAGQGFPEDRYVLDARKAIVQYTQVGSSQTSQDAWNSINTEISLSRTALQNLLNAEAKAIGNRNPAAFSTSLAAAIKNGEVTVVLGTEAQVLQFFAKFDEPQVTFPALTVR